MFADRADAGRQLAARLGHLAGDDVVVLGLPRGGVPVASEVAGALRATLDVLLVRKLGVPSRPELAMGAIGEGGVEVLNSSVITDAGVDSTGLAAIRAREHDELGRCAARFRRGRPPAPLRGRVAVVVDDGVATGSTAAAACQVARARGARRIVLAVPVGPPGTPERFAGVADEVVCLEMPRGFMAVGQRYDDFSQTRDEEVVDLLDRGEALRSPRSASPGAPA